MKLILTMRMRPQLSDYLQVEAWLPAEPFQQALLRAISVAGCKDLEDAIVLAPCQSVRLTAYPTPQPDDGPAGTGRRKSVRRKKPVTGSNGEPDLFGLNGPWDSKNGPGNATG